MFSGTIAEKKYVLTTFGCQMNLADAQRIRAILRSIGFVETDNEQEADLILFNTCCVRKHAEERLVGRIRSLAPIKNKNPNLKILIGGCLAQKEKDKLFEILPMVDAIFGPNDLSNLPQIISEINSGKSMMGDFTVSGNFDGEEADGIILEKPFSAFVNIIRGCTNYCSYCIVPYVRGPEVSRPIEEIVKFVNDLAQQGVTEITLLGQNVNAYGRDIGINQGFSTLLEQLNQVEGIRRIRFLTSHPRDFSFTDIDRISKLEKVCEHFHLPLQAGSDRILKLMNRGYNRQVYLEKIQYLRNTIPNVCITTDIICGFPGETEDEFEQTLQLVKDIKFDAAYTYYYSPRPGTKATELPEQLPLEIRKERLERLIELQNRISLELNQKNIGTIQEILVESVSTKSKNRVWGKTRTGKVVDFEGSPNLIGSYVFVKIKSARNWTMSGSLLK